MNCKLNVVYFYFKLSFVIVACKNMFHRFKLQKNLKYYFLLFYYPLYYFQLIIQEFNINYDSTKFPRVYQYLNQEYYLGHFKQLNPNFDQPNFPLTFNSNPFHLKFQKYFSLMYLARASAIAFIPPVMSTNRQIRILIGEEFVYKESFYFETTFTFWCAIFYLFLQFSLTENILDYKFCALFSMTKSNSSVFALSNNEFKSFQKFRSIASNFYHLIMVYVPVMGTLAYLGLYSRTSLYSSNPIPSIFWTLIFMMWTFFNSAILYCNIACVCVVAKYLQIKQKSLLDSLQSSLLNLKKRHLLKREFKLMLWSKILKKQLKYSHFFDEMADYGAFFKSFLSSIFFFYILIISFILHILFIGTSPLYIKFFFTIVLFYSTQCIILLIYYLGTIVIFNERFARKFSHFVAKYQVEKAFSLTLRQNILSSTLINISHSGFTLLNGYVVSYETLYLLVVNIVGYFMLISKSKS